MRHRKGLLPIAVMSTAGILLVGCDFAPPKAPTWDVDFSIPLIDKTYTMDELAEDNDWIFVDDQDDEVVFQLDDEIVFETGNLMSVDIPGGGQFYPLNVQTIQSFPIPTGGVLIGQEAVIDSGRMVFNIQNSNGFAVNVEFIMPEMFLSNETAVVEYNWSIPANSNMNYSMPMDGYVFKPPTVANQNQFNIQVTPIAGGQSGNVFIQWQFNDLSFSSITGIFDHIQADFDDIEIETDIPDFMEGFQVQTADLSVTMRLGIRLPLTIHFEVVGRDEDGNPVATTAPIDTSVAAWDGVGDRPTVTFRRDVANFINTQPHKIEASGYIRAGDGVTPTTVSVDDPIDGDVHFEAPLIMHLPSASFEMDVDTLELDEEIRDAIRDNLMSIGLEGEAENHIPFGARVTIYVSSTRGDSTIYDPAYTPEIRETIRVDSAVTVGNPGVVQTASTNAILVELTKTELGVFENPTVYVGLKFTFTTSSAGLVKVRPEDYITVGARLNATIHAEVPEDTRRNGGVR